MKYKDFRPRLKGNKLLAYENLNTPEKRILIIGDLHEPFTHPDYLDFCECISKRVAQAYERVPGRVSTRFLNDVRVSTILACRERRAYR